MPGVDDFGITIALDLRPYSKLGLAQDVKFNG
jgi:hypothetical protein